MEDNDDMLFGDIAGFETWSAEEQQAWRAGAPERLRKRLLEEEDNGEEGPARKTPKK